jgi:hypothetical protein
MGTAIIFPRVALLTVDQLLEFAKPQIIHHLCQKSAVAKLRR